MRKLIPILLLSFVNILGFSLLIPVLPEVLELYTGERSGFLYGLLLSSYAFSQFIGSPILGSLSDHYGRRPLLLVSQFGTLMSWVIFAAAFFLPQDLQFMGFSVPLLVIMFSRVTDGVTGGNVSVAQAWVSDMTTPSERTKAFGMIGATFGVGFLIGPALGGFSMSTPYHFLGTAVVAMVISLITLLFIYFGVPESVTEENRTEYIRFSLWNELNFMKRFALFRENPAIKDLIWLRLMFSLAFVGFTTSIILLLSRSYSLSPIQVGLILSAIGTFSICNQAFVVPRVAGMFGEYRTFFMGLIMSSIMLACHGLLPIVFGDVFEGGIIVVFFCISYFLNLGLSMTLTTFKTIITTNTSAQMQGKAMGLDESISSFGQGVVPFFAGSLYDVVGAYSFMLFGGVLFLFSLRAAFDCRRDPSVS